MSSSLDHLQCRLKKPSPPHAPLPQATGLALIGSSLALSELVAVQGNVVRGLAAVGGARALLRQCVHVGSLIDGGRLYHALLLMERIRAGPLGEPSLGDREI